MPPSAAGAAGRGTCASRRSSCGQGKAWHGRAGRVKVAGRGLRGRRMGGPAKGDVGARGARVGRPGASLPPSFFRPASLPAWQPPSLPACLPAASLPPCLPAKHTLTSLCRPSCAPSPPAAQPSCAPSARLQAGQGGAGQGKAGGAGRSAAGTPSVCCWDSHTEGARQAVWAADEAAHSGLQAGFARQLTESRGAGVLACVALDLLLLHVLHHAVNHLSTAGMGRGGQDRGGRCDSSG